MASFNGKLLKKGEVFSIGKELGPITSAKGYKAELVIKHDGTVPELGGGLCQVSTTAFRGALQGGFEIVERKKNEVHYFYFTDEKYILTFTVKSRY
jgi:vancomycin resistance protein YoaR